MRLRRSLQASAGQLQIPDTFSCSYDENMRILKKILANDDLIIYRPLTLEGQDNHRCCVVYVDGMVDSDLLHENVLTRLQDVRWQQVPDDELLSLFVKRIISAGNVTTVAKVRPAIQALLYGNVLLVLDSADAVIQIEAKGWEKRAISEPETERVVRGPREGFIENIVTNLAMIRRKVPNPNLKMVYREIGTRTKTKICIVYLEGVSRKELLEELQRRLDKVQLDGILEAEYIIELIRDAPLSPFETLGTTERPDTAVGKLLEGRILIVVDGSPFVITLPYLFIEYFQANKDYYENFYYSTVNRLLRYLSFFLTTSTPAIFVALTAFHQEMIPTRLLFSISAAKEGVPFPTVVEAFLMLTAFQILREAGIRLPSPVGQAVSIVGALVLGDAAVTAKIISAPMVIVAAVTGITSFIVPEMPGVAFLLSLFFLFAASFLGLFGYIFAVIALTIHLAGIRSFGVNYLDSITSIRLQDLKDTAIRAPWWWMTYRPRLLTPNDKRLADPGRPKP
ncbi:spore germination protein ka [Heliomicrobium modesticaldum Ice1]|uniref:Spore germination protein ka n=1 Tax=Heliobacterium modesticaldum (strain ATCC 51547 / Ice1) TaxID=498761 RepID=B0TA89_HELMI|nr:spore germination protein ka [Heliomicrobium modesticaldum Ice1]